MTHEPVRMCIVCRQRYPKGELDRYVCPDTAKELETDGPVPDPGKNRPGRGFYVCVQARCREHFPKMIKGLMKKRKGVFK
ncbi:conserved protein of unknown function [Pseudodesulfovibrio profundus]|uniref:YlxR domain-containing protein n=1 Tax=Pseudodesulfovibrio profundus TaxID=57320 RepID=A0A2C8F4V2_9BACT|nr:DUF448 domain-containing protein [Pseudodesulfovibrio profundus]MBC18029.1 hypothetical protein [Desulfovibrio sp.]SOB57631.1 conserved protein of unknown function [Pseudodesulfovibrio profundus]